MLTLEPIQLVFSTRRVSHLVEEIAVERLAILELFLRRNDDFLL